MRQLYEYHPIVGYRYIPNLKARIPHESGGYLMRVNASGFRSDREFVPERTQGKRRLLVFGDSFTAGDAVPNSARYTDLLETMLPDTEIYNFGLSSTGTDQQYLIWREFAQNIEHDAVVIAVFVENVRRVMARYRPHNDEAGRERIYAKPYYTLEGGHLQLHHVPPRRNPYEEHELSPEESGAVDNGGRFLMLRKLAGALGLREALQSLTKYQPAPAYDSPGSTGWQLMRAILSQWARSIHKPVLIMPIPLPQHIDQTCDSSGYQARFAELGAQLGCSVHDPLAHLQGFPPDERRALRWPVDIHFTPSGHRAIAESLRLHIERLLSVPAAGREART